MEKQIENNSDTEAENSLTDGVISDLNTFLTAIKGRTYLMKHSVHESNPLQKHFDEILYCINESIDVAGILSDLSKVDEEFKIAK